MKMRDRLIKLVRERDWVSFAEITRSIPGAKGEYSLLLPKNQKVILWVGMSKELVKTIVLCLKDGSLTVHPAHLLVYLADGVVLPNLPIARSNRQYKKPHWLPVTFRAPQKKAA